MIFSLVKRNLKIYFRDITTVFFSMLGVIIIIALYALFLGDMMVSYAEEVFQGTSSINIRFLMDSWIMAGVVIVATVTSTLGAYGIMVNDNAGNATNDFRVSPMKRSTIVLSYILSAFIIGVIMSILSLVLSELYIVLVGGELMKFVTLLKALGIIIFSVLMNSSIIFFIVTFIRSNNAFGAVSTVFGSMIGFLMGVYIPIGNLPNGLQSFIKLFPLSHPAVLLRNALMGEAVDLSYMPKEFVQFIGVQYDWNGTTMSGLFMLGYMMLVTIVFFGLGVLMVSRKRTH